jgi:AcrR family transcriptional regulator
MNPDSQSDRRLMPRKSAAVRRRAASEPAPAKSRAAQSKPRASKSASLRHEFRSYARTAILSAAEEVLAEEGLHAARIEEIAQRARVAVGTIYNLVGDRDALIQEILRARQAEIVNLLASTLRQYKAAPFHEQVRAAVLAMFEYFGGHMRFFRLVMETPAAAGKLGAAARDSQTIHDEIHKLYRELMQRGVKLGVLRAENSELFPAMLSGMLRQVMIRDLKSQDRPSPQLRADAITRMFFKGAGT